MWRLYSGPWRPVGYGIWCGRGGDKIRAGNLGIAAHAAVLFFVHLPCLQVWPRCFVLANSCVLGALVLAHFRPSQFLQADCFALARTICGRFARISRAVDGLPTLCSFGSFTFSARFPDRLADPTSLGNFGWPPAYPACGGLLAALRAAHHTHTQVCS